jgi:hypothetical protein
MKAFITGSRGLIGSKLVTFFAIRATRVIGVASNMRADFFIQKVTRRGILSGCARILGDCLITSSTYEIAKGFLISSNTKAPSIFLRIVQPSPTMTWRLVAHSPISLAMRQ